MANTTATALCQFVFFDVHPVKDVHDLASLPDIFKSASEISTVVSSSVGLLVADIHGSLYILSKDFVLTTSWVTHVGERVTHMAERKGVLVTIGEEDSVRGSLLKIWDLGRTDGRNQAPVLLRSAKIQPSNKPHPCFERSPPFFPSKLIPAHNLYIPIDKMGPERTKYCDLCQQDIKPCGYTTHHKACKKKAEKQRQNQHFVDSIRRDTGPSDPRRMVGDHTDTMLRQGGQCNTSPGAWNDLDDVEYHEPPSFLDADIPECVDPMFQVDDIKCEYHPSSRIAPEVHAFNKFKCQPTPLASSAPPNKCPWAPFKSQLEFEIAELALEACLNNDRPDCLIKFCNRCASQQEKFMFQNHKDIHKRISGSGQPIFSAILDCSHTWILMCNKPFTADAFWNVQSQLPPGGKPLAFVLYADKTRLLSFGTAKGYPVVAHLANLPVDICNGQGVCHKYC
ncbi:hypothetical protein BDR05DRAFT_948693 [Suillus weaverae]|nr:hypothetical protein BDR05DRAFT_948693 [Suillus weaverae]